MSTVNIDEDEGLSQVDHNVIDDSPQDTQEPEQEEVEQEDSDSGQESTVPESVKQTAKKHGHLSLEKWIEKGGKKEDYKDEEEFVEFGNSYTKLKPVLDNLHKTLNKREKEIEALLEYNARIEERERIKAKQEAQQLLTIAKQRGDVDAIEQLTAEKLKMEWQEKQRTDSISNTKEMEVTRQFEERNKIWYNSSHPEMMDRAKNVASEMRQYYPSASLEELALKVEKRMQMDYPDICGAGRIDRPIISNSTVNKSQASSNSEDRLWRQACDKDPDLKHVFSATKRTMNNANIKYELKDFIQQLKENGEL